MDFVELPSSSGEEDLVDYHAALARYSKSKKPQPSYKGAKTKISRGRIAALAAATGTASTAAAVAASAAGGGGTSTGGLLPGDRRSGDCDSEAEDAFINRHRATAAEDEEERLAKSAAIGSKSIKYGPGQRRRHPGIRTTKTRSTVTSMTSRTRKEVLSM